ncbi:hypothetical protein CsSME_00007405 [Camellia sinensis var. sinensis]
MYTTASSVVGPERALCSSGNHVAAVGCDTVRTPRSVQRCPDCLPLPHPFRGPGLSCLIFELSADQVIQFMVGLDADYFRMEGDYATFIQTHLMPSLTSVRRGEGARAPAARGRGRATRSRKMRDPEERQETGWPELPTSLTYQRRSRETYQILIAPASVGRALTGIRGSTPVCTKPHTGMY